MFPSSVVAVTSNVMSCHVVFILNIQMMYPIFMNKQQKKAIQQYSYKMYNTEKKHNGNFTEMSEKGCGKVQSMLSHPFNIM